MIPNNSESSNLEKFINQEKMIFDSLKIIGAWDDIKWDASKWLYHRGSDSSFVFKILEKGNTVLAEISEKKERANIPLPLLFGNFTKALAIYISRSKGTGFMAIKNYINECRRLYNLMQSRDETSPTQLTRWHFEETLNILSQSGYKNIYDAAANMKVIADLIDKLKITSSPIEFNHSAKPNKSYHDYTSLTDLDDEDKRIYDEKLPSYEALMAFAVCTNNPINNDEEILIRTIDLLIAMGQRGNEITVIPLDCWVETFVKDSKGEKILDAEGKPVSNIGIRYYAEKKFQSRVHWLAEQDIAFTKRAVSRLIELTKEAREIAKFQEETGKLWFYEPNSLVSDTELLPLLGFTTAYNLKIYLKERHSIEVRNIDKTRSNPYKKSTMPVHMYRAGDIENLLLPKLNNHEALLETTDTSKVLLKTSEVLAIRFEGAFRFLRSANTFRVLPGRVLLKEINTALGAVPNTQSIFTRRGLLEADGRAIRLTSHQPRHWRNTLYDLAGMSNVQQALALGRQKLDQNSVYQHTTFAERTAPQKDFLAFSNPAEKITFLHDGIRNKTILGGLSDTYFHLKEIKGFENAETFLKTHASALHITPFGGCTHDFSLAPCPKYLQCWNGCSHLHRTGSKIETEKLKAQLEISKSALLKMKEEGDGDYGTDVWVIDLETKISNLEIALKIVVKDKPVKLFPGGKEFTKANETKKGSSVSQD